MERKKSQTNRQGGARYFGARIAQAQVLKISAPLLSAPAGGIERNIGQHQYKFLSAIAADKVVGTAVLLELLT